MKILLSIFAVLVIAGTASAQVPIPRFDIAATESGDVSTTATYTARFGRLDLFGFGDFSNTTAGFYEQDVALDFGSTGLLTYELNDANGVSPVHRAGWQYRRSFGELGVAGKFFPWSSGKSGPSGELAWSWVRGRLQTLGFLDLEDRDGLQAVLEQQGVWMLTDNYGVFAEYRNHGGKQSGAVGVRIAY